MEHPKAVPEGRSQESPHRSGRVRVDVHEEFVFITATVFVQSKE
jgi:hypothetical protein